MRILGVHGTSSCLYLATNVDGQTLAEAPHKFWTPDGALPGERLTMLSESACRLMREVRPDRLTILEPETAYDASYLEFAARIAAETALEIGAEKSGVPVDRLTRQRTRSILRLPTKKPLATHVTSVMTPMGPYWQAGRNLAALVAHAGYTAHAEQAH